MNSFLSLIVLANKKGWCMDQYCTTCGATDFRTALQKLGGPGMSGLANALIDLDLAALKSAPKWNDGLRLTFASLGRCLLLDSEFYDRVLMAWLPQLDQDVRVADLVLFYCVRLGGFHTPSIEVKRQWTAKCIDLAVRTKDESLVESLVYTLGCNYKDYVALDTLVHELAQRSRRVSLAMERQEPVH